MHNNNTMYFLFCHEVVKSETL